MSEFFKAVKSCDPNTESMTVTVIDGEHIGEKAVITGGSFSYLSEKDGFIKKHEQEITAVSDSGVREIDGIKVYLEYVGHEKKLVICGCGHVSLPIIKLGKMLGFSVTAIDDRPEFAGNAGDAGADIVITENFKDALQRIESDLFTYYVIVTRGHHWDEECLRVICSKPHAYIGMMGSKRRVSVVKENLVKEGIDKDVMDNVHSPIGLSIGSETPEEIAVSILAEIIEIKNAKKDFTVPGDILKAVNGSAHEEAEPGRKILATIIRKEGSAPREAGTKMLILRDKAINTIGGGLLESRIITKAREMLSKDDPGPELMHLTLSADAASQEGEVCGGNLDVFIEEIKQDE